jgi:hypothetical protein
MHEPPHTELAITIAAQDNVVKRNLLEGMQATGKCQAFFR